MKKILSIGAMAISMLFMLACDPQDKSDYSLGSIPTPEDLDFIATPSADKDNVIILENNSDLSGVAVWEISNGAKSKGNKVTIDFPFKGDYTVLMTLYTQGGSSFISKVITIAEDDMSLLNTPMYNALTGGANDADGKTWVFDQYHDGHFGVGPADAATPSWWSCPAEGKTRSCMYSQEFTFKQIGVKLEWTNNGNVYTNASGKTALAALGYTNAVAPPDGDFDVEYATAESYTFSLNETAKTLTLSSGAFFGHYTGTATYEILSLTEDELYVKCVSTVEPGNGWWYRFIPKEKNVKPVVIIPIVAKPLAEDFESETKKVNFTYDNMGDLVNPFYSNPAPVGINTSAKAFFYQKTTAFYSNIFFDAATYKFDLTTQNKIKLKVYIPSYNDYETSYDVAGSWVSNTKLLKMVAVKLQNSALGGNAYTTQAEVTFTDLETDKWIELTFDFSAVSTREDFDRIVIQFGAEGHAGPGIFFFDDFTFSE